MAGKPDRIEIVETDAGEIVEHRRDEVTGEWVGTSRRMTRRQVIGWVPLLNGVAVNRSPEHGERAYYVHPVWADVDRPDTGGWVVNGLAVARRLEAAIMAGKAVTGKAVLVDVNGVTYVDARHHVMGKYMNADLRRLGF